MADKEKAQSNEKSPKSPNAGRIKKLKFDPLGLHRRVRPITRDNKTVDDGKPTQIGIASQTATQSVTPTSSSSDGKKLRKKATGPIEEEDKTQFERPEGIKSQPAVTGKSKEQQTGEEKLQKLFKQKKKRKLTDDEKTEFERCRGAARPAVSKGTRNVGLRWKKTSADPKSEVQKEEPSDGGSLIQQLSDSGSDISQISVIDRREEKTRRKVKSKERADTCEDTQAEDATVKAPRRPKAQKKKSDTLVPVLVGVKYIPSTTMIPEPRTPPYATSSNATTPDPSVSTKETNKEVKKPKKEEQKLSEPMTPPLITPKEQKAQTKKSKYLTCDDTVEATQENEPDRKSPKPQSRQKSDDEEPASVSLVPYSSSRDTHTRFTESSYIIDILNRPTSKSPQKHKNDQKPPSPSK